MLRAPVDAVFARGGRDNALHFGGEHLLGGHGEDIALLGKLHNTAIAEHQIERLKRRSCYGRQIECLNRFAVACVV